jgi:hypothetical protein
MSVPQRTELEAQVVRLRKTISAMPNEQDKFGLRLKLKRLEEELAEFHRPSQSVGSAGSAREDNGDNGLYRS